MKRRDFLKLSATAAATSIGTSGVGSTAFAVASTTDAKRNPRRGGVYGAANLDRIAFPMGGLGAGMICLEGTGALSHFSLRNHPEMFNEPMAFAALCIKGKTNTARVLEGPVPNWKKFGMPDSGLGGGGKTWGLPRFRETNFNAQFPFATVSLADRDLPISVKITGWSPFEPGDADNASLPVAALEYRFTNHSAKEVEAIFSWNARNLMITGSNSNAVKPSQNGFTFWSAASTDRPWEEGAFSATVDTKDVKVNHNWFRGGWFDPLTIAWEDVVEGNCFDRAPVTEGEPSPGATLFVPFKLSPRETKTIVLRLAWFVGKTNLRIGRDPEGLKEGQGTYQPWYAGRFGGIEEVTDYWNFHYEELRNKTQRFSDCFYDSTLPPEVIEAVVANLTILKSPTVLRQADGRMWAWEGCGDNNGSCHGSCTHVWNYAQAVSHLFPALERTLRETEFGPSQDERGHQQFRTSLPIRPVVHDFHAASDGQLGGVMKVHREWRISGDTEWLRGLWPKVKASLDYCVGLWDPAHKGWVEEPHHNTYDIEFWGPDGMCTSFYLGALKAATLMGRAVGDDTSHYEELLRNGLQRMESELYDGEYFFQKVEWKDLRAKPPEGGLPEVAALLEQEGPKYQYGRGCLSDGVLGAWIAEVCGVGSVLDSKKVASHLKAVHKYNFKSDLTAHANPQRPTYACGTEGGLLLCTWPKGGKLSLPFVYSNEVWTGIEYQVASHLILMGQVEEGLEIVRAVRSRYDGSVRNPFNEYECGHWYARAMSSYALLQALSGARYDAIEQTLHLDPKIKGDFRAFISTATGYGHVGVKRGVPFVQAAAGKIELKQIHYRGQSMPV